MNRKITNILFTGIAVARVQTEGYSVQKTVIDKDSDFKICPENFLVGPYLLFIEIQFLRKNMEK